MKIRFAKLYMLLMLLVGAAVSAHAEDANPLKAYATSCYAAYYTGQQNPLMKDFVGNDWENFSGADFSVRLTRVETQIGGMASWAYSHNYAKVFSGNMMTELLRRARPAVLNASVAQSAFCDQVYGISPAITAVSDQAVDMVERQANSRTKTAEETVTCSLAYNAGHENSDIRKSPLNAVFSGLDKYDFGLKKFELDLYADTADAFANVPQYVAYPTGEDDWKTKLARALEETDQDTQIAFLKEVAACDASFKMRDPLIESPLANPSIPHAECAARYNSLAPFYAQSPQTQQYFQQRALHAGRFVKLLGAEKNDQIILSSISAASDVKVKTYVTDAGQADPNRLMEAFANVGQCDQQYGLQYTEPPRELYRAARMAE